MGVFLTHYEEEILPGSLPHMRGGVSSSVIFSTANNKSSPHAWGCFYPPSGISVAIVVFPTCVGVFLLSISHSYETTGLPHMRGGVSY